MMVCEALVLNAPLLTFSVTVNVPEVRYWCVGLTLVEEFPSPKFHNTVVKPLELLVKVTLRSHAVWLVKLAESCAKEPPTADPHRRRTSRGFLRIVGIGNDVTQVTEKLLQKDDNLFFWGRHVERSETSLNSEYRDSSLRKASAKNDVLS